jgi:hypothetical protein
MKKIVLILAATSIALGAVTLHLVRELRGERAAVLELQARVAELEREPARAPRTAPSPFRAPEPLAASAPAPATAAPSLNSAPPPAIGARAQPTNLSKEEQMRMVRESMERQRALFRDPEYREAMRMQQKAMLPSMYPDVAAELELTADEADALMSLLADQQVRSLERDRPFFEGQADPAMIQEAARNQQEQQTMMDNEIRDLLGEDKWRAWNEYKATMGVRHEVTQLRTTLAMNGAPLEDGQVKALQRALLEAQQRRLEEWRRSAPQAPVPVERSAHSAEQQLALQEDALRRQRKHNEELRDALKSVLTDAQLRHIAQQHDAQLKLQEAHLRMMRAQAEADASGQFLPWANVATAGEAVMISNGAMYVDPAQ